MKNKLQPSMKNKYRKLKEDIRITKSKKVMPRKMNSMKKIKELKSIKLLGKIMKMHKINKNDWHQYEYLC